MEQAVNSAHIHKRAILGQILDDAGEHAAFLQMLERFTALLVLLFFQKLLARDHDVAALLIQLDDGDFHRLALHAIQIPDGTQVHLRARQKGASALNVESQSALDAFHDDALDRLLVVVGALNLVPRAQPLRLQVREVNVALFGLALLPQYVDLGAGLELWLALVIENFRKRQHAFGFRPDVDDDVGRGQFHDRALDDVVVAHRFLGFGLKALQRGGEVIGGGRGILVSGSFRSEVFRSFASRNVRGGSQWFRGRGLCLLGSVYYGRAAGVGVVGRCHGFNTGFRIADGGVVEQVHSLCVDARLGATCGTWPSGLLVCSLGCVEADLADDPRTIPAGSKSRPTRTL